MFDLEARARTAGSRDRVGLFEFSISQSSGPILAVLNLLKGFFMGFGVPSFAYSSLRIKLSLPGTVLAFEQFSIVLMGPEFASPGLNRCIHTNILQTKVCILELGSCDAGIYGGFHSLFGFRRFGPGYF
jgi:hypothetical protein